MPTRCHRHRCLRTAYGAKVRHQEAPRARTLPSLSLHQQSNWGLLLSVPSHTPSTQVRRRRKTPRPPPCRSRAHCAAAGGRLRARLAAMTSAMPAMKAMTVMMARLGSCAYWQAVDFCYCYWRHYQNVIAFKKCIRIYFYCTFIACFVYLSMNNYS